MEARRLISFGNSSYVISIPKNWLAKNGLNKGDFVYCAENGNNELILTPQQKEVKKALRTVNLNIGKKVFKEVRREFLSYYIDGYDVINVQSQLHLKYSNELRDIIRDITTMDIVEQNKKMIIAKDFLNIEKISLEDLTRRMDLIIRSMIEDSKQYNRNKIAKVNSMDVEVNRITFMLFRFIKKALNDSNLAKLFGLTPEDLLGLWLLASNLERVADEIKRIARFLRLLNITKKEFEDIMVIYSMVEKEYLTAMKSFYNKDKELALSVAANKDRIIEICNKFAAKSNKPYIGSLVEKFKGMEIFTVYLSRAVYE